MDWSHFICFALPALLCWGVSAWMAYRPEGFGRAVTFNLLGLVVFFAFIAGIWISLERPPLRTMGETRLWYSFFLPVAGLITYVRWRYKWILSFSTLLAGVFICINLLKPEIHNKTLMPALQSPWFAPARHRLYVRLCRVGSCRHLRTLPALPAERRGDRQRQDWISVTIWSMSELLS